jgi:hypothetical protein
MRFAEFDSEEGRSRIAQMAKLFIDVIARQQEIYRETPMQTAGSLLELWLLVLSVRPMSIFELGTAQRSSTIALALAASELPGCIVYGIDIAPREFGSFAAKHYPELRFSPVIDIASEATRFEIPDHWSHPVLTFYDAHDGGIPGKIISEHAISRWFPKLAGQTIAIHDCARAPLPTSEYLPQYVEATHWQGETIVGFPEVGPLVQWMNRNSIRFWRPSDALNSIGVTMPESDMIVLTVPHD